MPLHSLDLVNGKESTPLRKTQKLWPAQSTTLKSMMFKTEYLGMKEIALEFYRMSCQSWSRIVSSLLVLPGVVS